MDTTKPIPFREQNPKGLFAKYVIQKVVGVQALLPVNSPFEGPYGPLSRWRTITEADLDDLPEGTPLRYLTTEIDEGSQYFVLRLDEGGESRQVSAGRKAIHVYAEAIEDHLPKLAEDLRERYPLPDHISPHSPAIKP